MKFFINSIRDSGVHKQRIALAGIAVIQVDNVISTLSNRNALTFRVATNQFIFHAIFFKLFREIIRIIRRIDYSANRCILLYRILQLIRCSFFIIVDGVAFNILDINFAIKMPSVDLISTRHIALGTIGRRCTQTTPSPSDLFDVDSSVSLNNFRTQFTQSFLYIIITSIAFHLRQRFHHCLRQTTMIPASMVHIC